MTGEHRALQDPRRDLESSAAAAPPSGGGEDRRTTSLTRLPTEAVVRRWREGDARAQGHLYLKLRHDSLARIRKHPLYQELSPHVDAEDLFHDLFAALNEAAKLGRFEDRGPGSYRAWFHRCLSNTLVQRFRALHAQRRGGGRGRVPLRGDAATDEAGVDPPSPTPGPTTEVRFADWLEACREALADEPLKLEVWRLHVEEGRLLKEAAESLGVTASAARGQFHRAIEILRARGLLGDEG